MKNKLAKSLFLGISTVSLATVSVFALETNKTFDNVTSLVTKSDKILNEHQEKQEPLKMPSSIEAVKVELKKTKDLINNKRAQSANLVKDLQVEAKDITNLGQTSQEVQLKENYDTIVDAEAHVSLLATHLHTLEEKKETTEAPKENITTVTSEEFEEIKEDVTSGIVEPSYEEVTYNLENSDIEAIIPVIEEIKPEIQPESIELTEVAEVSQVEVIPFQTVYENDDTLELGKEVVKTEGVNGKKVNGIVEVQPTNKVIKKGTLEKIPFETTYQNDSTVEQGKEIVKVEGSEGLKVNGQITKAPVNKVILKGTKPVYTQTVQTNTNATNVQPITSSGSLTSARGLGQYGGNTYPVGQCTWGAKELAPWAHNFWGNGGQWAHSARAAGFTVGTTPVVGAIAVWDDGGYGHVAVVSHVQSAYSIKVLEANVNGNQYIADHRGWFNPTVVQGYVSYIYPPAQ